MGIFLFLFNSDTIHLSQMYAVINTMFLLEAVKRENVCYSARILPYHDNGELIESKELNDRIIKCIENYGTDKLDIGTLQLGLQMKYNDIEYYLNTLNEHIKDYRIQTLGLACNGWKMNENVERKGINILKVYEIADKLGIMDKISVIQSPMNIIENELIINKYDVDENIKKFLNNDFNENKINVLIIIVITFFFYIFI